MTEALFHSLYLDELVVHVHLGCTREERERAQEVRVSVRLHFSQAPVGAHSDQLTDTVCYAELAQKIRQHAEGAGQEFQLIERLARELFTIVRRTVGAQIQAAVLVHKVKPPVANLLGGTRFACGDFQW